MASPKLPIRKATAIQHRKMLIFGPPGAGKTHLLGTAQVDPRVFPMLILDQENGTSTLNGTDLDIWPIRSWDDYTEAYEYLSSGKHPYKSVVIETLTEAHIAGLLNLVELQAEHDPKRPFRDLEIQQGDYGKGLIQMRRLIRAFCSLPYHVIFTAHVKSDLETGEGYVRKPFLFGQLAEEVAGQFDVTACLLQTSPAEKVRDKLEVCDDGAYRCLILNGYPGIRVKTRTPWGVVPPQMIWNPTMSKLLDILGVEVGG